MSSEYRCIQRQLVAWLAHKLRDLADGKGQLNEIFVRLGKRPPIFSVAPLNINAHVVFSLTQTIVTP